MTYARFNHPGGTITVSQGDGGLAVKITLTSSGGVWQSANLERAEAAALADVIREFSTRIRTLATPR